MPLKTFYLLHIGYSKLVLRDDKNIEKILSALKSAVPVDWDIHYPDKSHRHHYRPDDNTCEISLEIISEDQLHPAKSAPETPVNSTSPGQLPAPRQKQLTWKP